MLNVHGEFTCPLTEAYRKLEKCALKRRKSRRRQKQRPTQKTEPDATTKNASFCSAKPDKTGCKRDKQLYSQPSSFSKRIKEKGKEALWVFRACDKDPEKVVVPTICLLGFIYLCEVREEKQKFQEVLQKIQGTDNYQIYPLDEEVALKAREKLAQAEPFQY